MIFIKRLFLIVIVVFAFSCQNPKVKSEILGDSKDFSDNGIQEIGKLYNAERINTRPVKVKTDSEKKDYIIEITNSDLLEKDSINLDKYGLIIANLYKKDLIKNRSNFKNIIVIINYRNGNNKRFEFTEKELIKTIYINTKQ